VNLAVDRKSYWLYTNDPYDNQKRIEAFDKYGFEKGLDVLAGGFGLESALGAFAAGMVVGLPTRGEEGKEIHEKIDAITFGFLVPFFFVTSGLKFDLAGLVQSAQTVLLVPAFLTAFLVVRGGPVFLHRKDLVKGERLPFALYTSTTLPMVVAISEIGVRTGRISPDLAAALVGAAMLSVLLFPAMAAALRSRTAVPRPFSDMTVTTSSKVSWDGPHRDDVSACARPVDRIGEKSVRRSEERIHPDVRECHPARSHPGPLRTGDQGSA